MSKNKQNKQEKIRHSLAHIMAYAVQNLYGKVKFGIGPVIENGFYYDIDFGRKNFSKSDLPKIEKEMKRIISQNLDFKKEIVSIKKAKEIFKNDKYKLELINDIQKYGTTDIKNRDKKQSKKIKNVSIYKTGEFIDLCAGPHVKNTRELKNSAFKLTKTAGAYWRGDEKNKMLTRIYGTAFNSAFELKEHLKLQKEAEKRDHRKLGKELEIFDFDDLVGKGLPLWLPNGTIIKDEIEALAKESERELGYQRVSTPHLGKEELYLTSGHLPYYKDSMYPPMEMDDGVYYLKAMNCPHHHIIYKSKIRSYKDLPVRLAEYGTCYRNELSGTLAGLLRVRSLQMNDAHIYCRADQIKAEMKNVLKLALKYFKIFGLKDYWFRLSKWDPKHKDKYINQPKNWIFAEKVLRDILKELKVKFVEAKDEAAFYGPKIDVQLRSVIGREETMATIQLDFLAKERFDLHYIDQNGKINKEVFVIHRSTLSTHERLIAFLTEHYSGAFPLWLSPVQIIIISVSKTHIKHAKALKKLIEEELKNLKRPVRIEIDDGNDTVSYKIRRAAKRKIPYSIVIGDKEAPKNNKWQLKSKITIREFGKKQTSTIQVGRFIGIVREKIEKRKA